MTAKKRTSKASSVIPEMTIQEFKIWIKGLSAFQDEGWYPNKLQWDHIMKLIDNLIVQESTVTVSTPYFPNAETIRDSVTNQQMTYTGEPETALPMQAPAPRFQSQPVSRKPAASVQEPFAGKSDFI